MTELNALFLNVINLGIITKVIPPKAKVKIKDIETDLLPILCSAGQTTSYLMPKVGEQVVVIAQNGRLEDGLIIGSIYSNNNPSPSFNEKEVFLGFEDGSFFKKTIGGTMTIKQEGDLEIISSGNIKINGQRVDIN